MLKIDSDFPKSKLIQELCYMKNVRCMNKNVKFIILIIKMLIVNVKKIFKLDFGIKKSCIFAKQF